MKKFFSNKRVLFSLGTIALVGVLAVAGTNAFFSDTETSTGNTFTAGSIDLSLGGLFLSDNNGNSSFALDPDNNGRALYNFTDLKPGDIGGGSFNLKVSSNDAYVCAKSSITSTPENGIIDPESDAGDTTGGSNGGELQNYVQFATFDDENGNGIFDGGEPLNVNQFGGDSNGFTATEIAAAGWVPVAQTVDFPNSWLVELFLPTGVEHSAGILYCFGNFDLNGDCTAPIGDQNDAMTDQMIGSIEFYAVQTRNNDGFTCDSLNKTVLQLENKDIDQTWDPFLNDGIYGELTFISSHPTFDYTLDVFGLVPLTDYSLIYYADGWPGNNPGFLIGTLTTDGSGDMSIAGDIELGMDLPHINDGNSPGGAKIWVVQSNEYDAGNTSMTTWPPSSETLFEMNLVTYTDL